MKKTIKIILLLALIVTLVGITFGLASTSPEVATASLCSYLTMMLLDELCELVTK